MVDGRCESYQGSPPYSRGIWRQPGHGAHKEGLNTKVHLAVDAHGMPIRVLVTEGTAADYSYAGQLIDGIEAQYLIADKGYDSEGV